MTYESFTGGGDLSPQPPASVIDELLSDELNQQTIRWFFEETVADYGIAEQKGLSIGTVENRPVPNYPVVIDTRGLVMEVTSGERTLRSMRPTPDVNDWSGAAITTGFLQRAVYGTFIYASLVDLRDSQHERVGLRPIPDGSSQANQVINAGNLYRSGGITFLFGTKDGVSITVVGAMTEMAAATDGKAGMELLEARIQATESLRSRGAYLLATELVRPDVPTNIGIVRFLDVPTEDLATARTRVGFEL